MPLHRIPLGPSPAEALARAVVAIERKGETVVQAQAWANEWLVLTAKPKKATRA